MGSNTASLLDVYYEEDVVARVYGQLRGIAAGFMNRERSDHILQPTALVHEAYIKLARQDDELDWQSQTQFVGCAAYVMRQVLVDFARHSKAAKRRGEHVAWTVTSLAAPDSIPPEDIIALDGALDRLAGRKPSGRRQARLVELVWLGGMSMSEAAESLGVSRRQAHRDWTFARVWLERELRDV